MYYNRILRMWVVDQFDYFLISILIGNLIASSLRNHLSDEKSMERLKNSLINKSNRGIKSNRTTLNSKEIRIKRVYRFALNSSGGQFVNFKADQKFSNESFKLAQKIKILVEKLASFLKEKEQRGFAKILFKNGRLILELILVNCRIDITYALITEGLSTQVIVITSTAGGILGFTISWLSAGASLVIPPVVLSILSIRSVAEQIVNTKEYSKFKRLVSEMLQKSKSKKTIRAFFVEGEVPVTTTPGLEMKPWSVEKNPLPEFNSNIDSDQTLEEFIKARMKEELGLFEDPSVKQIGGIIQKRKIRKRGKTVYFNDFIKKTADDPGDNIINAEIIKQVINEEP